MRIQNLYIGVSIACIEGAGILTQQNFAGILLSPPKPKAVKLLLSLTVFQALIEELDLEMEVQVITQEKFEETWLYSEPNEVAPSVESLQDTEIENQRNFSLLIECSDILMNNIVETLFIRLTLELLMEVVQGFYRANQDEQADINLLSTVPDINHKQSTHTASVHQSVSESATQLLAH